MDSEVEIVLKKFFFRSSLLCDVSPSGQRHKTEIRDKNFFKKISTSSSLADFFFGNNKIFRRLQTTQQRIYKVC